MGLLADIFTMKRTSEWGSTANGGISDTAEQVCIVNIPGPFEPFLDIPAVMLVPGNLPGTVKAIAARRTETEWTDWEGDEPPGLVGPMAGGTFIYTPDSRFAEAVEKITGRRCGHPVSLHDRWDTPQQYRTLTS